MTSDLRLLHWPAEDRASFTQFIGTMAEVQARIQAISGEATGVPVPRPPRVPTPRECAAMILKHRRDIRALAGPDGELFGDPAWEIMLAAFVAEEPQRDAVILDTAGLGEGEVGERWIRLMIARGWLERDADGALGPTAKTDETLGRYFQRL